MSNRGCIDNLLTAPPTLPLVAPSILSANFADLGSDCSATLDAGGDLLHVDVMDGHFAPNLTMGPALCRSLRAALPAAFLDVHLMVTDPGDFVDPFADAGADHFTFHVEADEHPEALADRIRDRGMTAGLAINPPTPVDAILPYLEAFDLILVMSVNPGFSGQAFIGEVLEKVAAVSARLEPSQRLQMDGGVSGSTAIECRAAGCDVLVAASAIFGAGAAGYARAVADVRGATGSVARSS
jgi:ribulose-phosphate 3-epimerase